MTSAPVLGVGGVDEGDELAHAEPEVVGHVTGSFLDAAVGDGVACRWRHITVPVGRPDRPRRNALPASLAPRKHAPHLPAPPERAWLRAAKPVDAMPLGRLSHARRVLIG